MIFIKYIHLTTHECTSDKAWPLRLVINVNVTSASQDRCRMWTMPGGHQWPPASSSTWTQAPSHRSRSAFLLKLQIMLNRARPAHLWPEFLIQNLTADFRCWPLNWEWFVSSRCLAQTVFPQAVDLCPFLLNSPPHHSQYIRSSPSLLSSSVLVGVLTTWVTI